MNVKTLTVTLPVSYELEVCRDSTQGILLLHGYTDHARSAKKRLLGSHLPKGFTLFAPNALFPSPHKKGDAYREAYSWYFRDWDTGLQMVSPEFAAAALLQLVSELGLNSIHWTILGFSQGGFFAPYLIRAGLNARLIISVGAAYMPQAYEGLPPCRVYALHGQDDAIVEHELGRTSFEKIQAMGYGVQFYSLAKLGHTLNDEGRKLVQQIIQQEKDFREYAIKN